MLESLHVTVLCENSVGGPFGLVGEHGWAVFVESPEQCWLFDTGQGLGLTSNAQCLGVDLRRLDGIALSHGHYDHTSGLPAVLALRRKTAVCAHPDVFLHRYWHKGGECREIGLRFAKESLEGLGAEFSLAAAFRELGPGLYLTGEIPRRTAFEPTDPTMTLKGETGTWIQDPLRDDQALVADTAEGLVVVLGCAHAGLINTLQHIRDRLPGRPFHTVVGGTHLGFAAPAQLDATLAELGRFGVGRLGASHCTGLVNGARLQTHLGDRYFFASVGTSITVGG
ncbi:MAG: MBL fold metallo-hydrolase [Deltaproteobacteria bacterium]|nr:MBL fold metallo-hydrolase [Deltaproteobacteria bacterium]